MSREFSKFEVTSRLVDFGSSVIQLAQVSRAGVTVQHPLRRVGVICLLAAMALLGAEMRNGFRLPFPPKASLELWGAFGLAATGVFMVAYAHRRLTIVTTDGARLVLPAADSQFALAVLGCLREAMQAEGTGAHYRIDMVTKVITPIEGPAARQPDQAPWPGAEEYAVSHPAQAQLPTPVDIRSALPPRDAGSPGLGHANHVNGVRLPEAFAPASAPARQFASPNPTASVSLNGSGGAEWPGMAPASHTQQPSMSPQQTASLEHDLMRRIEALPSGMAPSSNGLAAPLQRVGADTPQPRGTPISVPFQPVAQDYGLSDLRSLMQFIMRANLQHKEALLDLLRVVEDHKAGGPTSREEADAHWQSFAEYVQQYLVGYDGLADMTLRAGRSLEPSLRA